MDLGPLRDSRSPLGT